MTGTRTAVSPDAGLQTSRDTVILLQHRGGRRTWARTDTHTHACTRSERGKHAKRNPCTYSNTRGHKHTQESAVHRPALWMAQFTPANMHIKIHTLFPVSTTHITGNHRRSIPGHSGMKPFKRGDSTTWRTDTHTHKRWLQHINTHKCLVLKCIVLY